MNASGQGGLFETSERLFRVDKGGDEPDDIVFLEGMPLAQLAAFSHFKHNIVDCQAKSMVRFLSGWTYVHQRQGSLLYLPCCRLKCDCRPT